MKNMPQVTMKQVVNTPIGTGVLVHVNYWEGETTLGYEVALDVPDADPEAHGHPAFDAAEMRLANPGIHFPGHPGEICDRNWRNG